MSEEPDDFLKLDTDLFTVPTDEDESGVPMNEYDAMSRWRSGLKSAGVFTARIENIGVSLPDMFMIYKAMTVFQECKVRRGKMMYAPMYQLATMTRLSNELHPWQLIYVVFNKAGFDLYEFKQIREITKNLSSHAGASYVSSKVKIPIAEIDPFLRIEDADGIEIYLDQVHFRAFKKIRRPELQISPT